MLIWIMKALLTHQTGLWRFHFYWSDATFFRRVNNFPEM